MKSNRYRAYRACSPEMFLNKKVPEWVFALVGAALAAALVSCLYNFN